MNELNSSGGELLPAQSVNVKISDVRLVEVDNEPRVRDTDLGKRLGLRRPRVVRELIERNRAELERFGSLAVLHGESRGQKFDEFWLNEEQALLVSALSDAPAAADVRHMLIKVFVAWRRGHLIPANVGSLPAELTEMIRRDDGISRMLAHKVTGIEATVASISNALAGIAEKIAPHGPVMISRQGMTAGQIWRASGFPALRSTAWFGNRLTEMGCAMPGQARGQLGDNRARLFDPDKAAEWLKAGGRALVEGYIKERLGQGKLEGV